MVKISISAVNILADPIIGIFKMAIIKNLNTTASSLKAIAIRT